MFSRAGFYAKLNRRRSPEDRRTIDALIACAHDDPDKLLVMRYISELFDAGFVELEAHDNGEVEARFMSGEIYLLSQTTLIRLA